MEEKLSCYVFLRTMEVIEVTQEITNTSIIHLEALRAHLSKGLTIHNYVWENGRHRLRKSLLFQPIYEGGLGMVNIQIQNKSLKFMWFNRMLSDTANLHFWTLHLTHCFVIPLCDVLNCVHSLV